jgi:F0F1-type ATP synthase membrane subunit b/b'
MMEHAEHHAAAGTHAESHAPSPTQLFWPALNFLLFAVLMARVLRGPIREYFRERTTRLREALEAGIRARQAAETLRAELARAVANLPALRERLRADLRAAAEREQQRLVEAGRQAAARIRKDAALLAQQEFATARDAVRREVIEEAVRQATALIAQGIRPDDQERFVRDFVTSAGTVA